MINHSGSDDFFLTKFSANGNVIWAKSGGGTNNDEAYGLAIGTYGAVFLSGTFKGTAIAFNNVSLTSTFSNDLFISKLDTTILTSLIELPSQDNPIVVYPNPGNGKININCYKSIDKIVISDVLGQLIYQSQPIEKEISIELEHAGIYFVTIISENQQTTRKLVIHK